MDGGYDDGYRNSLCFWGKEPGSLAKQLQSYVSDLRGMSVLDLGCGEGKNAAYFARSGALVRALDVSHVAIDRARQIWREQNDIIWDVLDILNVELEPSSYDIVVAYGLLHCLKNAAEICAVVRKMQAATKVSGFNIVCNFNDRYQELTAHPDLHPCLMAHSFYLDLYSDWKICTATDTDLRESHPHNNIEHVHSMTRVITQRNPQ